MDLTNIEILPNWNENYRQDDEGLVNLVTRPQRRSGMEMVVEKHAS
jgi:hypothetical protein